MVCRSYYVFLLEKERNKLRNWDLYASGNALRTERMIGIVSTTSPMNIMRVRRMREKPY
jgi:hypothetical protein